MIKNLLRLVALTSSVLFIADLLVHRGDILPDRLFIELGFVWIGMLLGYKLKLNGTLKTSCAVIATILMVFWAIRLYLDPASLGFLYHFSRFWGLGPIAFILFGISHYRIITEKNNCDNAFAYAFVLAVLFPLITASAYIGTGWTARFFLDWEEMPFERFLFIRRASWLASMFLRVMFYVFLIRLFKTTSLQKAAESKWLMWVTGILVAFTGLVFAVRSMRFSHFSMVTVYNHWYMTVIPAVWYVLYYLYVTGKKAINRGIQIRSYIKKMEQEKGNSCSNN